MAENEKDDVIPEISILFTPKDARKGMERRAHKRFDVRLNVAIIKDKKTFNVCTLNVSMGGLLLANPVPEDFFDSLCRVIISSPDNSLLVSFEAQVLEASVRGSRIQFDETQMGKENADTFRKWLQKFEDTPK